ncbi:glycoside hydrolase family 97 protein [Flavitalea sp. BT771]|uniref:glycoside hydrolase family 97 protein n=1 Tax=Flavitalea sp. BT771 TaxID=3063329 RepID=UPI0026E3E433|nr:glycoside hydrolase family 97 protein [Flavitalea sp. BT771]MDO6431890.1 glycoside hydrolase family 97 protein [Flavitalea sp. BT771]MDV6220799.1 glycoside hydrolase family 97 protein [Flavitalea sp. BT771]
MIRCKAFVLAFFVLFLQHVSAQQLVTAGMNKVKMSFSLDGEGSPVYAVEFSGRPVIRPSRMGFKLDKDSSFYKGFQLLGTEKRNVDDSWRPVWGEVSQIRDHYEQLVVHLQRKDASRRRLDIIFRVFEDGVGFRYVFPHASGTGYFVVTDEVTEFALAGDHKTFWIPGDYDTNEYPYTTSLVSEIDNKEMVEKSTDIAVRVAPDRYAVQTPLMMKSGDGLYINIHEAGLIDYPAMQLHVDRASLTLTSALVPDAVGNKAYLHAPFSTPWRTVIVSDKAAGILSSKIILNLNEPSKIGDPSWIHPMKFVGVWWEMQTGKGTWSYSDYPDSVTATGALVPSGRHSANTENVKRYIDFAAAHDIQGVLVEGWNVGWEDWFGNWKENVFDFVTPYPDFNVGELAAYADSKRVHLIMHNETSGSATNYERWMDTAFRYMNQHGYTSVKTGYVGRIIPRGEHHDGQWMVNHYNRVAEKAASYHVMLDAHEPVRPTGLQRTYPNWLACEAGRGNEYNAFSNGSAPEHETILPFTRLMGGPMDYTPGIFKLRGYTTVPGRQMHTTLAKQLALYVTLYSPLQMAADLPENYAAHMDAFQFIRDVPVDWDDTRILEAEPGDYLTIARKEKGKGSWFVGAITDEHGRVANLSLDFLDAGKKYVATVYKDAPDADWKDKPEAYVIEQVTVTSKTKLAVKLAAGGGAAVSIVAAD